MSPRTLETMARWAAELRLEQVPERVVEQAKNQVLSILGATHAGYASDLGPLIADAFPLPPGRRAVVIPSGKHTRPSAAAFLQSAWSMVLDFDDSMLGGHTGHASVLVPLAYAGGRTGAELVEAQIVANELSARVNTAVALGPLRGQMATHVHLIGASAARSRLEGLDPDLFGQAVGFALTYPAKALYQGFLGSDAKVLAAAAPIRAGLEAVACVQAGLRGNPDTLDAFIHAFADVPVREFLSGLGERWHTETNSFKVYPVCGYLDAVTDATLGIVRRYDVTPEQVERVDVHASVFTAAMDARSRPYLDGADTPIPVLAFTTPYNVACAILDRTLTPDAYRRERIADPRVWELARRVRVHHDEKLTIAALTTDAPVGAALKAAGRDALRYLAKMTGVASGGLPKPSAVLGAARIARAVLRASTGRVGDLSRAEKAIGARVEVRTADGRLFREDVRIPLGSAGSGDHAAHRVLMRTKYLSCAQEVVGAERAAEALELLERLEELDADEVARLVELNTVPEG